MADDRTPHELIEELMARHSTALDQTRDWDDIAALYAEDGVMDAQEVGLPRFEGRDAVRDGFAELAKQTATSFHVLGNQRIDVDGDEGSGTCYFYGRGHLTNGTLLDSCGYYDDRYVATPEGWKFGSRIVHFLVPLDYQVQL